MAAPAELFTHEAPVVVAGDIEAKNVIIGNHNVQVTGDGCIVTLLDPRTLPKPTPLARPVLVRPRAPEPFVDRTHELADLLGAVRAPVVVEITGPAGVGKSWLLRRLAQEHVRHFADGLVFPLKPLRGLPPSDVTLELFDHFFERPSAREFTYLPTPAELQRSLSSLKALVLLDDCTLDESATRALADHLPGCALVSTRRARMLPEARVTSVSDLPAAFYATLAEQVFGRPPTAEESQALGQIALEGPLGTRQLVKRVRELLSKRVEEALHQGHYDHFQAPMRTRQDADVPSSLETKLDPISPERSLVRAALAVGHGHALTLDSIVALVHQAAPLRAEGARAETRDDDLRTTLLSVRVELLRLVADGIVVAESGEPGAPERFRLEPAAQAELETQPEHEAMLGLALDRFTTHAEFTVTHERAALLRVLEFSQTVALRPKVMRCVRVLAPLLITSGAWGSWGEALVQHGRAAEMLGDHEQMAWQAHETGVRALCLGDGVLARQSLERARRLRKRSGTPQARELTRAALRLTPRSGIVKLALLTLPVVLAFGGVAAYDALRPVDVEVPTAWTVAVPATGKSSEPPPPPAGRADPSIQAPGPPAPKPASSKPDSPKPAPAKPISSKPDSPNPDSSKPNQSAAPITSSVTRVMAPFSVKAEAKPSQAKVSPDLQFDAMRGCSTAAVQLHLEDFPPQKELTVLWRVDKSTIGNGRDAQVRLCSTDTKNPTPYTITADATDKDGNVASAEVRVEIWP